MHATIIISLIAILFAWIARFQKTKYGGLEVAFILLTVFMSIRYNFGNDYPGYLNRFLSIGAYSNIDLTLESTEIGWAVLNLLFQPIGFFGMVIVLTVFEYIVIYRLIKKYVPKNWYWLSVFIFTFSTSFMLVGASMMRQFLAMCITIIAVEFIGSLTEKEMIKEYLNSNVFICPSSIENCPNSVGEVQLLGMPVVSSYVGGVEDEETGFLYRFEEVEMLVRNISIVFDGRYNQEMSTLSIKSAGKRHNKINNLRAILQIYQSV